ncbi:hypothetical protein [Chromatocurvus halotolerans]|uniref:Methyltransferase n=1 Tax=Chromatocurvus halotolerans TaxID=1132028 RepID=A0A4R2KY91_9GAMM|nr:hypothetical protein [Chromatocurvus halotolerans]TCO77867.1 hypothetical protein EV688_102327 [Chromatocurvus halotolerans]
MKNRIRKSISLAFAITSVAVAADVTDTDVERLEAVLPDQTEDHKARHSSRNPAGTLAFFGITPGMTVVEVLPGGGWYSRVLADNVAGTGPRRARR